MERPSVYHGATTAETLLADAAPVIKKFMDVAEGDINYNAIAMAPFQ
jgi:ubiquitin carboxyl-terminal hydrolase L3